MTLVDHFEQVTDKDGAVMARRISREEGIFVGYSCGSSLQGLMQLKSKLKKDDVVVVVFPDHGSRYVGKIYNDQWMMERGYLDVKTLKDIVNGRSLKPLITVHPQQTVAEVIDLMKAHNIESIPVLSNGDMIGSISETGLFHKMLNNGQDIKQHRVEEVLEPSYPIVSFETPVERLTSLMNKENGAVLSKDDSGNFHIVTKYDVIQSLAN
jgi:cystathionine beta-synthase